MYLVMLTKYRFKTQITWLSTGLILLTVLALTASYWLRIADYAEQQIKQQFNFAENVLNQNLVTQEKMLITAASVLAADFGFKQAVASQDKNTINSVLLNHGERINADLMMLLDLEGSLITTSASKTLSLQAVTKGIQSLPFRNVHAQFLRIDNTVYQVIVLPVKAPRVIAYTVIGFEFGQASLTGLKEMISLDISIAEREKVLATTLESGYSSEQIMQEAITPPSNILLSSAAYYHQIRPLGNSTVLSVVLSASLTQIHHDFNQLISSILFIAFFVIVIAIALSRLLSNGLSKPLNTLMHLTQRVGRGDLVIPKLSGDLPREFTELYQSFSVMGAEIESREKAIKYQAERDLLTGLYNRQKMLQELEASNDNKQITLVAFNIKDFKTLNDTIGISNGDKILQELAHRIFHYLGPLSTSDVNVIGVARTGADEFLVAIDTVEKDYIAKFLAHLQSELDRPYWVNDIKINLSVYVGIAQFDELISIDAEHMIRRASMAVSAAISEQVTVRYYQQGEDEAYMYKLSLIDELKSALEAEDSPLFMNYQPKLNMVTGRVDKLEALIRWINKEGDFVNPELFVGLAEKAGLIVTLTRWVILHVIQQVEHWNLQGYTFKVSINLSAQDIQHDTFVEYLLDTVAAKQVEPQQITLELTERDLAENENLVASRLTYLKSIGFQISVDDYGIGQSSLAKLKHLPVDELKIDKCFILNLDKNKQDQDIVMSTVLLGHRLGLQVVAEGVETAESLALLNEYNCDYAQGYYLSKPLSAEKLIEWYESYETTT
ncbi:EAL domain-containing protein [Thalassotalea sp. 1_MG-2023]|uniref:putative bifunctional diguanylate cyclase/phosphodiesterase n=1 Tax=Thalassotalea sp. 1_MG-2023 TaxID=3062680 RepID=UPI0026E2743F|nr:GGDEF domain-containing phosphodiesterase [Thalassotalea sp. 1_MG-2023]MDO6425893.1 EAL domain-containing protein [Thalassotalea sp. 1_MG-2023]